MRRLREPLFAVVEKKAVSNGAVCLWQVETPKSVLTAVPVPGTDSIHFHPLTPSSNLPSRSGVENSKFPVSDLPYKFQLDDISTNFARVSLRYMHIISLCRCGEGCAVVHFSLFFFFSHSPSSFLLFFSLSVSLLSLSPDVIVCG